MRVNSAPSTRAELKRRRIARKRRMLAFTLAPVLAFGGLVAGMWGATSAVAAEPSPDVLVSGTDRYIAGEDLTVSVTFESGDVSRDQFNLSAGLVLDERIAVFGSGTLGTPRIYPGGTVMNTGGYLSQPGDCTALGLEPAGSPANACRVPVGSQYLVFQNISDLPMGATATHGLTLRPDASVFDAGTEIELHFTAYTSDNERFIPTFPGSTGNATGNSHTSEPGIREHREPVGALRITKSEPSPESELLRGVHDNTTTYTLRVAHTGEGDVSGVKVVDFLPAGLEYLGQGEQDNSAPGVEYEDAGRLTGTPVPDGDDRAWPSAGEESVETVIATAADAEQYGVVAGRVYTKVTWDLGTLLATSDSRDMAAGVEQIFDTDAGRAGYLEIHYRAGIPLFENTMDFGGTTPSPASGAQGSNLDNNNGPSTRHGHTVDEPENVAEQHAGSLTNAAGASGVYKGSAVSDETTHTVDAVDVRVIKSVVNSTFTQGALARYTLSIDTSEYVTAVQGAAAPDRIVDTMGDGICPAFPVGTEVFGGGDPQLTIADGDPMSVAAWNAALQNDHHVGAGCAFPSTSSAALEGAELVGIAFDPATGHFSIELHLDAANAAALAAGPNASVQISYSAAQNSSYVSDGGKDGATSSGDTVTNQVEAVFTTTPRAETAEMGVGGDFHAWDDSEATLTTRLTEIAKTVLPRSAGVPTAASIASAEDWVDAAPEPFTAGDEVWWRIHVEPPAGVDVRNPKLTDFLPEGVVFDADAADNVVVVPSDFEPLGSCDLTGDAWLTKFIPAPTVNGNVLTWELGADDCLGEGNDDRFMPILEYFDVYIKTTVVGVAAFGQVDFPENLVKYQQNNVDGEIFFLRDAAQIEIGHQAHLLKGIVSITDAEGTELATGVGVDGDTFNGDIDGLPTKQGDQVRFRIDVAAPEYATQDYVVWDALPEGIVAADVSLTNAYLWDGTSQTAVTPASVVAYDPGAPGRPADVAAAFADRAIVVWDLTGVTVPADPDNDPDKSTTDRAGLTLEYTITIPGPGATYPAGYGDKAGQARAAIAAQEYVNTAQIVTYAVDTNGPGTNTHRPEDGPISTTPAGDDESGIPSAGTYDDSDIFLSDVSIAKRVVSTEVGASTNDLDAGNGDAQIVQGELVTFEYTVTIPAHTTVLDGVLSDQGKFRWTGAPNSPPGTTGIDYEFFAAEAIKPDSVDTAVWEMFDFEDADGTLTFPATYSNATDDDQVFAVQITVWVRDADATSPDHAPDFPNGKDLTNTAQFVSTDAQGNARTPMTADANVQYIEPNLTVTKAADPNTDVQIGTPVTYTITVTNPNVAPAPNPRAASYDNTVVDTVPAGLRVVTAPLATAGATFSPNQDALTNGLGGTITWPFSAFTSLEKIAGGDTVTLTYEASIDPDTGGGHSYTNEVDVTGYTLPAEIDDEDTTERRGDRTDDDDATITAITAAITKGVRIAGDTADFTDVVAAPIGETVEYEIVVSLNANINYYNARIVDAFSGTTIGAPERVSITGPTAGPTAGAVPGTWVYDDGVWTVSDGGVPHILSATEDRTLTIVYRVTLEDDMNAMSLPNTARFQWTSAPGGDIDDPEERGEVTDNARVDILNPQLAVEKLVDGEPSIERDPDATFNYTLQVTNTGSTPAHHITIVDVVPVGVVVDESTISPVQGVDGVLTGADPTNGGGTITWANVPGPLAVYTDGEAADETIELGYSAAFAPSAFLGEDDFPYENVVDVTRYESFEDGGWVYQPGTPGSRVPGGGTDLPRVSDEADVTPLFPRVVPTKQVTGLDFGEDGIAYVGEDFSWTLLITNAGAGTANAVDVVDTLPVNWEYVPGTATLGGAPLADPVIGGTAQQTLTWKAAALTAAQSDILPLAAGDSFEIVFDSRPTDAAIDDAGTGLAVGVNPHTNAVEVANVTDTQDNPENGDGHYRGDEGTADAYIAEADLLLQKAAIGGVIGQIDTSDNLYGLDAGTWVSGQAPVTDQYAQPQWQLTVTNHGPDAATGPFEVIDTPTLPLGVTMGSWSARYYASAADAVGTALTVSGGGTADAPLVVGDGTTSLAADGSDRIVLAADVNIPAGVTATGDDLSNIASVEGATFERPAKKTPESDNPNEDEANKPLAQVADLAITKTVNTTSPTAGMPITWQLTPRNLGPSDSVSSDDQPITVTDTVPAGVSGVTAGSNGDWVATLADGDPIPALGVGPGTVILWTYQHAIFVPGASAPVTLTGTIDAGWTATSGPAGDGSIVNVAIVHPGETEDPDYTDDPEDPQNNVDIVTVTPGDETSLAIAKTRVVLDDGVWRDATDDDEFAPGERISYRIDVTNNGPAVARSVQVVDESPEGLSYQAHVSLPGGTWTRASGGTNAAGTTNAAWDTFSLGAAQPVGQTRSFVVTYDTDPALDPEEGVENWAEASAENSSNEPRDDDDTNANRRANLSIVKSHTAPASGEAAVAGESVDYRLVITNEGPSDATAPVDVTDTLPAGFSYRDGSARVSVAGATAASVEPTEDGQDLTWTDLTGGADLAYEATIVITFTADIAPDVAAQLGVLNIAVVDSPEDTDPSDNRSEDPVDIVTSATMTIIKEVEDTSGVWVDEATKVAGTNVTYRLTIENEGPSAVPASVTDSLPGGLTLVSMSGAGWDCSDVVEGAQSGTCDYLDTADSDPLTRVLHPVGISTITVVAFLASDVPAGTELENEVTLTWVDSDGEHSDEDTAEVTATNVSDLGVKKAVREASDSDEWIDAQSAADAGVVIAGAETEYRLQVTNHGPSDAVAPLEVADTLPAGATFVELVGSAGWTAVYDEDTNTVVFTRDADLGGLAYGDDALEIVYTVAFDPALESGAVLDNTAELTELTLDANNDGNPDNDADPAFVEVERLIDLSVVKTHDAESVRIGDELAFDLAVHNAGPSDATEVVVTDTLPAGLEYVSEGTTDAAWTVIAEPVAEDGTTTITATLAGVLAAGADAPALQIVTIVHVEAYPEVVNVAVVTGEEPEEELENNDTEDPVTVPPMSTLVLTKEAVGTFQVGSDAIYRITVRNDGPTEDPGPLTVTDVLPEGLSFVSADAGTAECAHSGGTVVCERTEALGVDETWTIQLRVAVRDAAFPEVVNSAVVETPTELTPESDPSDSVTTPVEADPLAGTGGGIPLLLLAFGVPMIAFGVVLVLRRRRRV